MECYCYLTLTCDLVRELRKGLMHSKIIKRHIGACIYLIQLVYCNDQIQELEHGMFVRVKTVHLNGKPRVLSLKQDLHYWPTWELRFDRETAQWHRKTIKALNCNIA